MKLRTVNKKHMYYKTKITSETGQKIKAVWDRRNEVYYLEIALAKAIGFEQWSHWQCCLIGDISFVHFPGNFEIDTKVWKKFTDVKNAWCPRLNTKVGKAMQKRFDDIPTIPAEELGKAVGFDDKFKHPGFLLGRKDFYYFNMEDNWKYTCPEDCKEILASEYKSA